MERGRAKRFRRPTCSRRQLNLRRASRPPSNRPATPGAGSARDRNLADVYGRAKAALDSGAFGTAASLFETLQRDEPGYRDAADLHARAKEGIAASVKQTMDAAAKLESSGDLPEALRQLRRVAQIDPSMAIVAEQAMTRVKSADANGRDAGVHQRQAIRRRRSCRTGGYVCMNARSACCQTRIRTRRLQRSA